MGTAQPSRQSVGLGELLDRTNGLLAAGYWIPARASINQLPLETRPTKVVNVP